jgi:dipeptide/tripeptide permease
MLRQERSAWLSLSIIGLACVTFCVLLLVLGVHRAIGAFGLLCLSGLIPWVTRADRRSNVLFDERDAMIQANSVQIAYAVFWVVFVGASMGLWALYERRGMLPVQVLPLFPLVGWIVVALTQSIATLVQYARGR